MRRAAQSTQEFHNNTRQNVKRFSIVWLSAMLCNTSPKPLGRREVQGDNPMLSSAKRAHAITLPVSWMLPQRDFEIGTMRVLVPEGAMEVELDVGGFDAERRKESQFDVGGGCRRNQHESMFGHLL